MDLTELQKDIIDNYHFNKIQNLNYEEFNSLMYVLNYYYFNEKPLINDKIFDKINEYYEEKYSKKYDVELCYDDKYLQPVDLPVYMQSIKKIYIDKKKKLPKFIEQYDIINISSKLDGVSCLFIKKNNNYFLYTKGNGSKGRNISHLLNHINFNYKNIKEKKIIIRGELIIKSINKHIFNSTTPLRNICIGMVNRKPSSIDDNYKYIDLVCYQIIKPEYNYKTQFQYFIDNDLLYPKNEIIEIKNIKNIEEFFKNKYNEYIIEEKYYIDGLIIAEAICIYENSTNDNDNIIALKIDLSFETTKVIDIKWNTTKCKRLIPIIHIDPIVLNDSTISKVNGNNASFIINNSIGIGSTIKVIHSGNIIPNISNVIEKSDKIILPSIKYKWDNNKTHFEYIELNNESLSHDINLYYDIFNIKLLSQKTILNILNYFSNNDYNITNIFEYIEAIEKWDISNKILGVKKDILLKNSIKKFQDKKSIVDILTATNQFTLMSNIKINNILKNNKKIIEILKSGVYEDINIDDLCGIDGIQKITANNFISGLNYYIKNKNNFDKYFNIDYLVFEHKLKVVFSNIKKKDEKIKNYINLFYESTSINKNIDYLIVEDLDCDTVKTKYANKNNIKIILLKDFIKILKNN